MQDAAPLHVSSSDFLEYSPNELICEQRQEEELLMIT